MPDLYAHAVIEDPESGRKFQRGDAVPDDLPGIEELREFGSVSDEEYVAPEPDEAQVAAAEVVDEDTVIVGGVEYKRAEDGATIEGDSA